MFLVKCPKCQKLSKAYADHAGRRGKCPHCGKKIVIVAVEGESPTEEMPQISPQPETSKGRRRRVPVPDTSPPTLLLALVAAGGVWLFFRYGAGLFAGGGSGSFWEILLSCGWIGRVEVFLFLWGLLLLVWKAALWFLQRRPLQWEVFPARFDGTTKVQQADIDACLEHVHGLTRSPRRSIMLNRVCLALEHLRQAGHVQEVRGALGGQSAIDANLLDSSYMILRFLIWVLPIVGFIGTVMGIGFAVAQFGDFIPQEGEQIEEAMQTLRAGLGRVTTGLGTAFNTTLVALVLVTPLMLLTSWLRKFEERLLAEIDQFSNHNLLGTLGE
jgi:biopolymer transport protein ExbB/TolQ/DNA-directed RNA polymerase subunit RPC12/RpoP